MAISNLEQQIKTIPEVLSLNVGDTYRGKCPACGHDNGFVVTRIVEGLLYCDHRVRCNLKGFIGSTPMNFSTFKDYNTFTPQEFYYDTWELTTEQLHFFRKYYLSLLQIIQAQWSWCDDLQRIVMPLFDIHGRDFGNCCRYYYELEEHEIKFKNEFSAKKYDKKTKAVMNFFANEVKLYYPYNFNSNADKVYLVEDIISAIRVNDITHSCLALLGTHLDFKKLERLQDKRIIFCLDEDATDKAYGFKKKYNLLFNKGIEVRELKKDPKDMTNTQIKQYVV